MVNVMKLVKNKANNPTADNIAYHGPGHQITSMLDMEKDLKLIRCEDYENRAIEYPDELGYHRGALVKAEFRNDYFTSTHEIGPWTHQSKQNSTIRTVAEQNPMFSKLKVMTKFLPKVSIKT